MADVRARSARVGFADALAPGAAPALAEVLDQAPLGVVLWDSGLRYVVVNRRAAEMHGVPADELLGRRPAEVIGTLGSQLEQGVRRVLDSGEAVRDLHVVGENSKLEGTNREWLVACFPWLDQAGARVGAFGWLTEREETGAAGARRRRAGRRQVDAELRALYAALPVGVGFVSPDLRFLRVNEALAAMNGRPVAEHIGASLREVLGERADLLAEALERVMSTRAPLELSLTVPRADGSGTWEMEATYFPVVGEDGQLLGVGGVIRDVTERRELEAAQGRLLDEALAARAEAEAGRARVALLAEAGRAMAESIDWETTLRAVVRSAVPAVADWSALSMTDDTGRIRVVAVAHADPERERLAWEFLERYPRDPEAGSGAAQVIRSGEIEVVEDLAPEVVRAAAQDSEHLRLLENLNVRHYVIAPLSTPNGVAGALTFVLGDSGRRFEAADLELITSLAARAALHIQSARLYAERSHIADVLQAGLRPGALPAIPGVELAARFRPAGDQIAVGGDFYDVFGSGDGLWTAFIGDVAGKGPEAAAVTALARHTLRTAALLHDDPAANLALLNQALTSEHDPRRLCSVFYARLCPGERGVDCRFANGGHPSPLILRNDGTVEAVEHGRGAFVGAFADAGYLEATLHLEPGEVLLMYTDGVTEIRGNDVALGERELRIVLSACARRGAEDIVAAVEQRAVELQAGQPRDDIALLAIKATDARPKPRP